VVAQLLEALRYKPEGRGFDFALALSCRTYCGLGVDSANKINESQGYLLEG
jgi:hypothetical protein